jgi:4-amino-4-deoxy-L-arabinose transferase-like glycosyltransferase
VRGAWRADAEGGGGLSHSSEYTSPAPRERPLEPTRAVLLLILIATALRLGFGWALGLGVDESYMVSAGRTLSLGYFDHPPASWWLSWGAAHLLGNEAPIVVRLPFILLFALSTWLMFRLGTEFADGRAGFYAALLLNLSPVFGVTTGTWVLPDGPLDCALLAATLALLHALPATGPRAMLWWLTCGLFAGLALFSKYSAILWFAGALLYLLSSRAHRHWLAHPAPWLAVTLAALMFAPVAVWNATHGWASFAFQGERAAGLRFHPLGPLIVLAGEALFVLPWIWAPMLRAALGALRRGPAEWRSWLLCCLAAPPILGFALIAVWSGQRVLFHWAAPGYLMLFPVLGQAVARGHGWLGRRTLVATAGFVVLALAVVSIQIRLDWLGSAIAAVTRHDPDLDGVDWVSLRSQLGARGLLTQPSPVIGADNWRDAGKIAYALGPLVAVLCLNRDARQFGFATDPSHFIGSDVLLLVLDHPDATRTRLNPLFDGIEILPAATIILRGRVLATVTVLRGIHLRAWPPA